MGIDTKENTNLRFPFTLGALSTMPAVYTFAMYAALAIFFNFLLQISAFISILALDAQRSEVRDLTIGSESESLINIAIYLNL